MTSFECTLAVEPVPKGRPRFGQGRVYTPEGTAVFENTVRWLLRAEVRKQGMLLPALTGRLGIHAVFWVREERSDGDNYIKAVMDAGNKILYKDDRQIKDIRSILYKITPGMTPHIDLAVWELDDATLPEPSGSRGTSTRSRKATSSS